MVRDENDRRLRRHLKWCDKAVERLLNWRIKMAVAANGEGPACLSGLFNKIVHFPEIANGQEMSLNRV